MGSCFIGLAKGKRTVHNDAWKGEMLEAMHGPNAAGVMAGSEAAHRRRAASEEDALENYVVSSNSSSAKGRGRRAGGASEAVDGPRTPKIAGVDQVAQMSRIIRDLKKATGTSTLEDLLRRTTALASASSRMAAHEVAVAHDAPGETTRAAAMVDTTGDGRGDVILVDSAGDGKLDSAIPLEGQ